MLFYTIFLNCGTVQFRSGFSVVKHPEQPRRRPCQPLLWPYSGIDEYVLGAHVPNFVLQELVRNRTVNIQTGSHIFVSGQKSTYSIFSLI